MTKWRAGHAQVWNSHICTERARKLALRLAHVLLGKMDAIDTADRTKMGHL